MAVFFSETIAAHLAGETIGLAILGRFGFVEQEYRLWLGSGIIEAGNEQWIGIGQWGGLSSIVSGSGDQAQPVNFTLSGIDEGIIGKIGKGAPVRGRPVSAYLQFFHGETMKPLDIPAVFWSGKMDRVSVDMDAEQSVITMTCEGLFTNRSKPPAGLLTDRDQKVRFLDDLGLQFVTAVVNKNIKWPTF